MRAQNWSVENILMSPADLLWPAFQLTSFSHLCTKLLGKRYWPASDHHVMVRWKITLWFEKARQFLKTGPFQEGCKKSKLHFGIYFVENCKASSAFPSQNYHYMHSWNSLVLWFWLLSGKDAFGFPHTWGAPGQLIDRTVIEPTPQNVKGRSQGFLMSK